MCCVYIATAQIVEHGTEFAETKHLSINTEVLLTVTNTQHINRAKPSDFAINFIYINQTEQIDFVELEKHFEIFYKLNSLFEQFIESIDFVGNSNKNSFAQ